MQKRDLDKNTLYEGVKALIDCASNHIHLPQQKLYTLFSVAFQYMLFKSTKEPGFYIVRVEDSYLLDKLQKKSKDMSTRKFLQSLALPRRLKYGNSTFVLDFFNISTWAMTNDLPKEKIKGALVVKNASKKPIGMEFDEEDEAMKQMLASLPDDYYYSTLQEFVPNTVVIAFEEDFQNVESINFPFIKEEPREKVSSGVKIASNINLDDLE
tara:strand:+ start:82178 stop:82810 length:633 start_codon:yes stop_codon:yes gene_type:complete